MGFYQLYKEQKFPSTPEEVWAFISSPGNLKKITPVYMGFEILTNKLPDKIYPGMIIHYKVRPFWGIDTNWITEITHVQDHQYFVDEQRSGPYVMWHHEHHLKPVKDGVAMTDIVSYKPPYGFIGSIAHTLFIQKKLNDIFNYRVQALEMIFGKWE